MTGWKWVAAVGVGCLVAILLGAAATRADPSEPHKKLFTGRWYQQVVGGDYDAWMTLSTSQLWLLCDGNAALCGSKWTSPAQAAVDDWNSQPTTVRFQIMPDQSTLYDVNVEIDDLVLGDPNLLGIALGYDVNYDYCGLDCTVRFGWALIGDNGHTGPYGTADTRMVTIGHEIGHLLSLRHESVNADESVRYPCGQDDTGPIPHSIMSYDCINPVAEGGFGETDVQEWDVCGVSHAYFDPNLGYAGCGCDTLSTSVSPPGSGSVARSPTSSGFCPSGQYAPGTVVSLTANPATGYEWSSWSGTNNNGVNATTVTMNGNRSVTANFSEIPRGYWLAASDGGIFTFGDVGFHGSTGDITLNQPVVGMAATESGNGYWFVATDGGIFAFGDAGFHGSTGSIALNQPIVGMAVTPSGNGYLLVASDGGIFTYGDAGFHGSAGDIPLVQPIVGMAATPSGNGYWLVASDGGIFTYGDAGFFGSAGDIPLVQPIVGMAATPTGNGYWLVATDGGIFTYGDAGFHGSTGSIPLNQPIVGMAATPSGQGYWLVATDGGIFAFGDALFFGSTGSIALNQPIVGMAAR